MNILKYKKKFPVLDQPEIFEIIDDFRKLDIDDKGYVEKKSVIESVSDSGKGSYDEVRNALKAVDVDASGRVELDDYVELLAKIKEGKSSSGSGYGSGSASNDASAAIASGGSTSSPVVHKGTGAAAKVVIHGKSDYQSH
ncbi:unnamed protein product [[Candida] boidinii]|nr:unnamed protein product [[Candida] boidinii]